MADKKNVYTIVPHEDMINICNAIREKTGFSGKILAKEMGPLIRSIVQGESGIDFDGWFVRYYDTKDKIWEIHGIKNNNHDTPPLLNPPTEIGKTIVGWRLEDGTECNFPFRVLRDVDLSPISIFDVDYLCFLAEEVNSTVAMQAVGSPPSVSLEYSIDGETWSEFIVGTTTVTLANIGDKMYLRGDNIRFASPSGNYTNYNKFVMTGKIDASGNLMTIFDKSGVSVNFLYDCACYGMFRDCTSLTSAPELPATTLSSSCYRYMFYGCTSLTSAPELPATTLGNYCYTSMFENCTLLTSAPELPATTLLIHCYGSMFHGCTSLTSAPELPATTLSDECYEYMFYGCTSLTSAPELPAITLEYRCYDLMFRDCTSLTSAPELPATTLSGNCYSYMFYGCTSLTSAPELPATTLGNYCYFYMFYGCTSLTSAPELPATTLRNYCYGSMFRGCTGIKLSTTQTSEYQTPYRIPTSGIGTTATYALNSMFANTGGTFTGTPEINTTYYLNI